MTSGIMRHWRSQRARASVRGGGAGGGGGRSATAAGATTTGGPAAPVRTRRPAPGRPTAASSSGPALVPPANPTAFTLAARSCSGGAAGRGRWVCRVRRRVGDPRGVVGHLGRGQVARRWRAGQGQRVEHLRPTPRGPGRAGCRWNRRRVRSARSSTTSDHEEHQQRQQAAADPAGDDAPRPGPAGGQGGRRSGRRRRRSRSGRPAARPTRAAWSAAAAWAGTRPRAGAAARRRRGSGRSATQPTPAKSTSGQASASAPVIGAAAGRRLEAHHDPGRQAHQPAQRGERGGELLRRPAPTAGPRVLEQEEPQVRVRVPAGRVGRELVVLGQEALQRQRPQVRRALARPRSARRAGSDRAAPCRRPRGSARPRRPDGTSAAGQQVHVDGRADRRHGVATRRA